MSLNSIRSSDDQGPIESLEFYSISDHSLTKEAMANADLFVSIESISPAHHKTYVFHTSDYVW